MTLSVSSPLSGQTLKGSATQPSLSAGEDWPTYGGDQGGLRFSESSQITRDNLSQLHPVWTFHTHALESKANNPLLLPSFETTPVLSGDTLYLTSPFNVVFALNARTGMERWEYDPKLASLKQGAIVTSRGVAMWPVHWKPGSTTGTCTHRVFEGTLDGRLIALDAEDGKPCVGFGNNGTVDLTQDVHFQNIGFYGMTSPPTVVGNVVVVGSTVGDNQQVDIESGAVRGYDVITGKRLWLWEPLPWAQTQKIRTGAGNAWSVISADPALGLVYVPTGSAAPDMYGGLRPGDNRDADSVVALDAATGKKVWAFQVVHHNVWDYDVASEPILFTWRGSTPAIAVTTKMGMIFILDRRTGAPLIPVEERPVPQSGAPGESLSPTQPFQNIPLLSPIDLNTPEDASFHRSAKDQADCRAQMAALRYDGIYTPPNLKGSVAFPGNLGGVNWGGAAIDPTTGILYANTNRIASFVRLVPRHGWKMTILAVTDWWYNDDPLVKQKKTSWLIVLLVAYLIDCLRRRSMKLGPLPFIALAVCILVLVSEKISVRFMDHPKMMALDHFDYELSPQRKTPYLIERHPITDASGHFCTPTPWGAMTAINLNTLTKAWEKPLGTMVPNATTGALNFGGPIVTRTGLVFTGATEDPWLRVFDAATGEELHKFALPVPGIATPMTYTIDGKQYVVIAAGGHGDGFSSLGDSLIAFGIN